jgi:hypothetical protein
MMVLQLSDATHHSHRMLLQHFDAYPQCCHGSYQDATTTLTESFFHLFKPYPFKNFKKEQKMSYKIMIFDFKEYEC